MPGVDHDKLDHKEFSFEDGKNSLIVTIKTTTDSKSEGVEYLYLVESKSLERMTIILTQLLN